ncbi:hypothetical protein BC628DRAFT_65197 [Trametes gibbosa]|nr:hypothetical protein BC628DRAFT_65197 [Trametes gibbosa]
MLFQHLSSAPNTFLAQCCPIPSSSPASTSAPARCLSSLASVVLVHPQVSAMPTKFGLEITSPAPPPIHPDVPNLFQRGHGRVRTSGTFSSHHRHHLSPQETRERASVPRSDDLPPPVRQRSTMCAQAETPRYKTMPKSDELVLPGVP